jgi:hypothetical protein
LAQSADRGHLEQQGPMFLYGPGTAPAASLQGAIFREDGSPGRDSPAGLVFAPTACSTSRKGFAWSEGEFSA